MPLFLRRMVWDPKSDIIIWFNRLYTDSYLLKITEKEASLLKGSRISSGSNKGYILSFGDTLLVCELWVGLIGASIASRVSESGKYCYLWFYAPCSWVTLDSPPPISNMLFHLPLRDSNIWPNSPAINSKYSKSSLWNVKPTVNIPSGSSQICELLMPSKCWSNKLGLVVCLLTESRFPTLLSTPGNISSTLKKKKCDYR